MFRTYKNQNSFIFSVDHNAIFDHKYSNCIDPGNSLSIVEIAILNLSHP